MKSLKEYVEHLQDNDVPIPKGKVKFTLAKRDPITGVQIKAVYRLFYN